MTGIDVLRLQLKGSFNNISGRLADLSDDEWDRRVGPGTSKLGFILWHCARIIDWTAHSAIQGGAEVADRDPWRGRFPQRALYGAGISEDVADSVTQTVTRSDTAAYLADVQESLFAWFEQQTPESLDAPVSLKATQARRPEYLDPAVWAEIEDLDSLPAWGLLIRPAAGHIRGHCGEFDALRGLLRSGTRLRA
jgi:hypothetical protein